MFKLNPLTGFSCNRAPVPSSIPSSPDHRYDFESVAAMVTDEIGSDDFTKSGSGFSVVSGKNGNAINFPSDSHFSELTRTFGGTFSVAGWYYPTNTETSAPIRISQGAKYIRLFTDYATDSIFGAAAQVFQGSQTSEAIATFGQQWIFYALAVTSGVSVKACVNSSVVDVLSNVPTIGGSDLTLGLHAFGINSSKTFDQLLIWDSVALTEAQMTWLYNGGVGRFHPW